MADLSLPPPALAGDSGEAIFGRIASAVAARGYDLATGTAEYTLAKNFAIELYGSGVIQALRVYQAMFLDTAPPGDPLTKKGVDYATLRLPATPAVHPMAFTGQPGLVLDAGALFQTASSRTVPAQVFALQMPVTLAPSGAGSGAVQATTAGAVGNVAPNAIRFGINTPLGLTSATNPSGPSTVGVDEEDWEDYRERLKRVANREPGRDNVAYYTELALARPAGVDIGWVLVDVLWAGPNTTRLVVLKADDGIPTPTEIAALQVYFDPGVSGLGRGVGGAGDFVTVVAPTEVDLRVRVHDLAWLPSITAAGAQANVEAALATYLRASVNPGGEIKHRDLENAVHDAPGVADFGLVEASRDAGATWTTENFPLLATEKALLFTPVEFPGGG